MSVRNMFSLQGEVAIVTGAGKGLGKAIALAFAEAGAHVVCAARTEADIQAVAEQAKQYGVRALAHPCDVSDEAQLKKLVETTHEAFGKITLLVNNAGGAGPNDPLKTSSRSFDEIFHFNVTTAFALTRMVVPHMQAAGHGSVINITSAAARLSQRYFSAYGTAKAALTQLTKLLAQDFAPTVRVNGIAPGPVMTDALATYLTDEIRAKMIELTPLKTLGEPEDIAAAALYLASPASRWMSGKILELDGGAETTTWPM